ncbi:MAG: cupin domain-containing protein [Candidatus Methanospirareceae archaeon]
MKPIDHIDVQGRIEYNEDAPVKHDLLKTEWFNAVLVSLEAGQEIPPHPEPYAVLFIVLDGEGTVTVGTERYEVKPKHVIFAPQGSVRGIAPRTRMSLVGIQQPH